MIRLRYNDNNQKQIQMGNSHVPRLTVDIYSKATDLVGTVKDLEG